MSVHIIKCWQTLSALTSLNLTKKKSKFSLTIEHLSHLPRLFCFLTFQMQTHGDITWCVFWFFKIKTFSAECFYKRLSWGRETQGNPNVPPKDCINLKTVILPLNRVSFSSGASKLFLGCILSCISLTLTDMYWSVKVLHCICLLSWCKYCSHHHQRCQSHVVSAGGVDPH